MNLRRLNFRSLRKDSLRKGFRQGLRGDAAAPALRVSRDCSSFSSSESLGEDEFLDEATVFRKSRGLRPNPPPLYNLSL